MSGNLFEFVKNNVKISQYVQTLPQFRGMSAVGRGKYRCNNVIAGGTNTNAMVIDDETGFFKAFSHGNESGDIITLHALIAGLQDSPKDAAIDLANTMGITVPEDLLSFKSNGSISRKKLIDSLNKIMEKTHEYLVYSDDKEALMIREYLYDRGISDTLRDEWMLGALPSNDKKARKILTQCANNDILKKVGLYGGKSGDFIAMRGRLLFPILSRKNECISFSSRSIPEVNTPLENSKYINTSNTDIYDKSKVLYGQHFIKNNTKKIIVCEGNFDVIALNEMTDDETAAVATCGTALTHDHIGEIKRLGIKELMIVFDSDKAGRKAASSLTWITNHISHAGIYDSSEDGDPWDMYMSGKNFNFDYQQPLVSTASKMMAEDLDRDDFSDWFKKSYSQLNFVDDQQMLISSSSQYAGLKERYLKSLVVSSNNKKSSSYRRNEDEIVISDSVKIICAALLSFDLFDRKFIAFPLYHKKMVNDALDICGVETDEDEEAIRIAAGNYKSSNTSLSSYVYSLLPEEESEDYVLKSAVIIIARNLQQFFITYGTLESKYMFSYISALSSIADGSSAATAKEQLIFVFDIIGTLKNI